LIAAENTDALHVLHAVLSLDVGGLERLVVGLVHEGVRRGQRASVLCIEREGALAKAVREAGAEVVSLGKPPGRLTEYRRRAAEVVKRLRPDVVHTHQLGAAWYVGPGAEAMGTAVVHTEHGHHLAPSLGIIARAKRVLFGRSAAKRIGRFCCVSAEIAASVTRQHVAAASKVAVVPNGVDLETFNNLPTTQEARARFGIPADAVVLGTVGRLAEVKQQDLLLGGAAELSKRFENLWVLLVGDGPERGRLEALARELGIAGRCVFAGFQLEPEIALAAMDVFALTSRSEGFPVSLLEAWAAGVPIAAPRVGGIPDIVADGQTGLLFAAGDLAGLCAAVERLLLERTFAAGLIERAKQVVEARYSLSQMARAYEQEYTALLPGARGRAKCASSR
jgi:glycosyltransferase involved in cell wall biosynthesis